MLVRTLVDCRAVKIELGRAQEATVPIPVEEPLTLELNGEIRAILMRLPGADKELAVGFCVSEGLVRGFQDILLVHHCGEPPAEASPDATLAETQALPSGAEQADLLAEDTLAEDANRVRVLARRVTGRQQVVEDYQTLLLRSGCGRTRTFKSGPGSLGDGAGESGLSTGLLAGPGLEIEAETEASGKVGAKAGALAGDQAEVGPEAEAEAGFRARNGSLAGDGAGSGEGPTYADSGVEKAGSRRLWVESNLKVRPAVLSGLRREIATHQTVKRGSGGVHAAALFDACGQLLVLHEDIGRHNALDKVIGHALIWSLPLDQLIAVTTGRASYEMVTKAARVGIPILLSFSSPTSLAVEYAQACRLTIGGYLRGQSLIIHTHPWRLAMETGNLFPGPIGKR